MIPHQAETQKMCNPRTLCSTATCCAAFVALLASVSAQAGRLDIVGSVLDESGQPIKGAQVAAESPTGQSLLKTDENGRYRIDGLPAGGWKVVALAHGYRTASTDVQLTVAGKNLPVNFVLARDPAVPLPVAPVAAATVLGSGIEPLTTESLEIAVKATNGELAVSASPIGVKMDTLSHSDRASVGELQKLIKDAPFSVLISTPYSRAGFVAAEARRKFQPPPTIRIDELNAEGLTIEVSPGGFTSADAIENVVLKRGDAIMRPLASNVVPVTIENAMGAKKDVSRGSFRFPINAFAPTSPVTIILVGRSRNFEIPLTVVELSKLR